MKLNITKNEKKEILSIVKRYENVNLKIKKLQEQSEKIDKELKECESEMAKLSEEEKKTLESLKKKYGKFNLQDISDTIYG